MAHVNVKGLFNGGREPFQGVELLGGTVSFYTLLSSSLTQPLGDISLMTERTERVVLADKGTAEITLVFAYLRLLASKARTSLGGRTLPMKRAVGNGAL